MRIGIVAGEPSGDQLAAALITALHQIDPALAIEGIAGPAMLKAGCKAIIAMEQIAVMGLVEIIKHIPAILNSRRQIADYFINNPPDIFIGVDAPDFNLTLAEKLKNRGIKTVHYVSPTIWAWRQRRLKKIKRAVDLMLTLLPFEAQFYRNYQIPVEFVGHYLADDIPLENNTYLARVALNLPTDAKIMALLPGSRSNEIHYLTEVFIATALKCLQADPALIFIAPMVNAARKKEFTEIWQKTAPQLSIIITDGQAQQVIAAANIVLLASGTATLETMLYKKPMVVAYRMAPLSYAIAKRLVKTKFIALPNLLANKRLVPEFIQQEANVENLTTAIFQYLNDPVLVNTLQLEFTQLHNSLRLNASDHAAKAILQLMNRA